ncbi:O-antigen ligase family protein [Patescibacteria group bacterium]|nr:O-antigen ligase family protein [Patescibacteria group bacterium]
MTTIIKYLFGLFLFIFPFSIRWVFYEPASYRFGNFNPWVTGFVYLPELLLGLVFVLWIIYKFRVKNYELKVRSWLWGLFFLFVINAFVVTLIFGNGFLGAMFVLRVFEALIVFWLLTDGILPVKQVVTILLFGAVLQILWGYAQWRINGSLGLTWLGESVFGPEVFGVAKIDLADGAKQVRAYGSFLHSNIMAAYLLIVLFLSLRYLKYGYKLLWIALFTWGIYLANSQAAMVVGVLVLGLYFLFASFKSPLFRKGIGLAIVVLLISGNFWFFKNSHAIQIRDLSIQERLEQNVISRNMWSEHPFGVGVSDFTLEMENFNADKLLPWEFQPVHNTYFLILNETGIQGLVLFLLFLLVLFDRYWQGGKAIGVFILLFLMPFDHFLWDSWVGLMLVAIVAGFFVLENHPHKLFTKEED